MFLKFKGDFYRHQADILTGEKLKQIIKNTQEAYNIATKEAEALNPENHIRLGLALNFSVFYFENLNKREEAIKMAEETFNAALGKLS